MRRKSLTKNEVTQVLNSEPLKAGEGKTSPAETQKKVKFVKNLFPEELIKLENGETFEFPSVIENQRKYYLHEAEVSEELAKELRKVATKYRLLES
jgi:hypothetical protein